MARKERPDVIDGKSPRFQTPCGRLYITLNNIEGQLGEVEIKLGKAGNCQGVMLTFIGTLLSIILQEDYTKQELYNKLERHGLGISCGQKFFCKGAEYKSCLDLIIQKCMEELKE